MKVVSRILSMILAVMMVVSCMTTFVFAADGANTTKFSDVSSDKIYSDAVVTLNLMGVINGYPDGTFGPDKNVTRAEFTAMLMRTLKYGNMGSPSAAGLPFSDIDDNNSDINWAIPDINTAYGMGVINGYEDGTFRPSDNVAYEEAVKMIVCTLGYGEDVDISGTPWYANYISLANQNGITKVASSIGAPETPASRACIAQLLYDSLEVRLIENGTRSDKTILSDYLGYTKCEGIVSSNGITSLSSPDVNLRDDEIQITAKEGDSSVYETHTYTTKDNSLKDCLGSEIEFYYVSDGSGTRTLMFSVLHKNKMVTVNAANIEKRGTTDTQIKYYEQRDDDREKSLNLEASNVVIFNGKLYGKTADDSRFDADMVPEVGEIRFIDSDGNGRYDVVDISSYDIYYVSSKAASTYEIIDNVVRVVDYPEDKTLKLDTTADRNLTIVNASGAEVSYSSIATGNVICLAKSNASNGGEVIRKAVVLSNKITGTVSARGENTVTISGKEYHYSNAAPWMKGGELAEPQTQDNGTYVFDINGDLVAYNKEAVSENIKYGYIEGYSVRKNSFDGEVEIRILNSSGSTEMLGTYKSTRVDGNVCATGIDVVEALKKTATNPGSTDQTAIQQLVKYTTKSSGGSNVIDKIITAEVIGSGADVVSDKLNTLSIVTPDEPMTYNSTSKVLTNENGARISIGNSIVISVPEERNSFDEFRKTSVVSSFKNGVSTYSVEVFDVSKTNAAKIVVVYGADNSQGVDSTSPVYVLNEMTEAENSQEGSIMLRASGYKSTINSPEGEFTEWISDSSDRVVNEMTRGDIFRAGTDKYGYTLIDDNYIIYDVDGRNKFGMDISPANASIEDAEYVAILGTVVARDENAISVAPEELGENSDYDSTTALSFDTVQFEDAMVLIYDSTEKDLVINKGDYVSAIAGLTSFGENKASASKVLIYMSDGEVKLLCVLPQ